MRYSSEQSRRMGLNKKRGNAGEQQAAAALRRLGILMVEEIGTPFVITKTKNGWFQGYWKDKVSGDLIGHTQDGVKVLAEVKTIMDRNLRWSDLDHHQPGRLDENAECAISLLVWVHDSGIHVLRWPVPGFGKGTGITPEQAKKLNINKL